MGYSFPSWKEENRRRIKYLDNDISGGIIQFKLIWPEGGYFIPHYKNNEDN